MPGNVLPTHIAFLHINYGLFVFSLTNIVGGKVFMTILYSWVEVVWFTGDGNDRMYKHEQNITYIGSRALA